MALDGSDEEDAPLDPAAERLRRKLVRLLFISGGITALGLIAVFSAIVYKVGEGGAGPAVGVSGGRGQPVEASIAVPPGARLVSIALDDERALLHLEGVDGSASLLLVDLASGKPLGRYPLQPQ